MRWTAAVAVLLYLLPSASGVTQAVQAGGQSVPLDTLLSRMSLDDHVARFAAGSASLAQAMRGTFIRPALQGLQGELRANPGTMVPAHCGSDS